MLVYHLRRERGETLLPLSTSKGVDIESTVVHLGFKQVQNSSLYLFKTEKPESLYCAELPERGTV